MDHLHFSAQDVSDGSNYDPNHPENHFYSSNATWPLLDYTTMARNPHDDSASRRATASNLNLGIRTSSANTISPLQTAGFNAYSQAFNPSSIMTATDLQFGLMADQQAYNVQDATHMNTMFNYGMALQQSPIEDLMPNSQEPLHNSVESSYMQNFPAMDNTNNFQFQQFNDLLSMPYQIPAMSAAEYNAASVASHSPYSELLSRSLSQASHHSNNSWVLVDQSHNNNNNNNRSSFGAYSDTSHIGTVSPQSLNLHIRTDSNSTDSSDAPPLSAHSHESWGMFPISPEPEAHHDHSSCNSHHSSPHGLPLPSPREEFLNYPGSVAVSPVAISSQAVVISSPSSSSTSPVSSTAGSPKTKRRNSPITPAGITTKVIVKKAPAAKTGKDKPEKKVGRRKGPLRPEQRQQAHEIRKLRACLRCKFLKKVCDKGDPCGGCQPSHARLWQVPCTRMAIQDIAYFLKDWNADYDRHVTCAFSITNITGFANYNRELYITHGYGYVMPVAVREVFVIDEKPFGIDWVESIHDTPREFEVQTARLSAGLEGISHHLISHYIENHIFTFEKFVDDYFENTPFLMDLLKTVYRFYVRTQNLAVKKGLKLVIAYALTLHITMVEPACEADAELERIDDEGSRWYGKIPAPVMINFQIKKAMADMWRELMKDVLEELSSLYSSVYSGDKLKNWPTIFMLATLILTVWEMMQFDQNYRVPDKGAVSKFCDEMEGVPLGVIVGLFGAISTKLPSFLEWDTRKHSNVLANNQAVCDTMTEVRAHVEKHESYLRTRNEARFDREDFDSLSNKFLAKLVIRSN
ncbi:hypothetical protein FKW77_000478 [Venturia effusa]|uniref:Zn(2)-C6 fungal-type domain-containing protein n=1 Tax=Venturia effusa TaxID=50376 RepID=A0A517LGD3_9PEZI|nr:hypothetical protein FKW77_000478 [Venturia effusa]